jgi:hypothetical protein
LLSISPCHDPDLTPSAAYPGYCIIRSSTVSHSQPVWSLARPCYNEFSTFPQIGVTQWIETQLPSRLPPEIPHQLDCLQLSLQFCSIMAFKGISSISVLRPPNSQNQGQQVHTIMACQSISKLGRSQSWSAFLSSLDHCLQVYLQICSIPASEFAWSLPVSKSPNLLIQSLRRHL